MSRKHIPEKFFYFARPAIIRSPLTPIGLGKLATEGVAAFEIPGDHANQRSMLDEPFVHTVAEQLSGFGPGADAGEALAVRRRIGYDRISLIIM